MVDTPPLSDLTARHNPDGIYLLCSNGNGAYIFSSALKNTGRYPGASWDRYVKLLAVFVSAFTSDWMLHPKLAHFRPDLILL